MILLIVGTAHSSSICPWACIAITSPDFICFFAILHCVLIVLTLIYNNEITDIIMSLLFASYVYILWSQVDNAMSVYPTE